MRISLTKRASRLNTRNELLLELEDSPKKRIDPLKKASHMKVQKVKKPGFIKMPIDPKLAVESSDEEEIISPPEESTDNPKGKADLAICVEESDEDERVSPTASWFSLFLEPNIQG